MLTTRAAAKWGRGIHTPYPYNQVMTDKAADAGSEPVTPPRPGYVDDKVALLRRLSRVEGQVRGVRRMVDDETYCIDVLTQIAAVRNALDGVALKLLADHTDHCVRDAVARGGRDADEKVGELMAAVERFARAR
jgi:CsoR family transcriptional regulator, copper-sensing transcriptional repressor